MTLKQKRTALTLLLFCIAAAVLGGGYWLYLQKRDLAWAVLLDILEKEKAEIAYSEESYSLFSQTLTVRNLRVYAKEEKHFQAAPDDSTDGRGGAGGEKVLFQVGELRLTGAGYSGEQDPEDRLIRFDRLDAQAVTAPLPEGSRLTVDSVSVGPSSGGLAALRALSYPETSDDYAALEKALGSFSIRDTRLAGVSIQYASPVDDLPSFTFSATELSLGALGLNGSGPLLIKDIELKPAPGDGSYTPGLLDLSFLSIRMKEFGIERLRAPKLSRLWAVQDSAPVQEKDAAIQSLLRQDFGLGKMTMRDVKLAYSFFEANVEAADVSLEQTGGATSLTTSVEGLNCGKMLNFVLLQKYPELGVIPDAANIPLAFSGGSVSSIHWFAPENKASVSVRYSLRDIADAQMDMDMATMTWEEFMESSAYKGVNPFSAEGEDRVKFVHGLRSITITLADHRFFDYAYKILAAKTGSSPEQVKAMFLGRFQEEFGKHKLHELMTQPAVTEFLNNSGMLKVHFAARNGTVSTEQLKDRDSMPFTITATHTGKR